MRRGLLPAAVGSPDRRLDARVAVERPSPAPFCSAAAADGAVDGGRPSAAAAATPGVCGAAARLPLLVAQLLLAAPLGAPIREPDLQRMPTSVIVEEGKRASAKFTHWPYFTSIFSHITETLFCNLALPYF